MLWHFPEVEVHSELFTTLLECSFHYIQLLLLKTLFQLENCLNSLTRYMTHMIGSIPL